jgi:hypothetical protein
MTKPRLPRPGLRRWHFDDYLLPFGGRWLSALAAAVFEVLLVRPSLSTFDAAVAAFLLVVLFAIESITSFPGM